MLVLTRNEGQSIQLDDNILITVTELSGGQVKIGIAAPKEVNIVRSELLERNHTLHKTLEPSQN